jgi:hypothetical protein
LTELKAYLQGSRQNVVILAKHRSVLRRGTGLRDLSIGIAEPQKLFDAEQSFFDPIVFAMPLVPPASSGFQFGDAGPVLRSVYAGPIATFRKQLLA